MKYLFSLIMISLNIVYFGFVSSAIGWGELFSNFWKLNWLFFNKLFLFLMPIYTVIFLLNLGKIKLKDFPLEKSAGSLFESGWSPVRCLFDTDRGSGKSFHRVWKADWYRRYYTGCRVSGIFTYAGTGCRPAYAREVLKVSGGRIHVTWWKICRNI